MKVSIFGRGADGLVDFFRQGDVVQIKDGVIQPRSVAYSSNATCAYECLMNSKTTVRVLKEMDRTLKSYDIGSFVQVMHRATVEDLVRRAFGHGEKVAVAGIARNVSFLVEGEGNDSYNLESFISGVTKQRELDLEGQDGGRVLVLLSHGSAVAVDESAEGARVRFGPLTVVRLLAVYSCVLIRRTPKQ